MPYKDPDKKQKQRPNPIKDKEWRDAHREELRQYQIKYRAEHPQERALSNKKWHEEHPGYETERARKRRAISRDADHQYQKNRLQNDPYFRATSNLRRRIRLAIKGGFTSKAASTQELLGAPFDVVRTHIESLWKPGMSWENYGKLWHIRHIVPIKTDRKVYFHYRNLKPTFNTDKYNVIKSCHKEILKKEINKPFEIQYRKSLCNFCS